MSNGVLTFTLGLETSNFLRNLGMASGQIISFAATVQALRKISARIWNTIGDGGRLQDLSNRTGASVKDLYQLEQGFNAVGVSADQVGPMILRLRQALGGVDEEGKSTKKVFEALGLDMDRLSKVNPVAQFALISDALNKVGGNKADVLAKGLFGRDGAGNIMQITRDLQEFQRTLRDSSPAASRMQQIAPVFDDIGDSITRIKGRIRGMWTEFAAWVAPALKWVADSLDEVASRSTNFSTFIVESFKIGFETVLTIVPPLLAKLGSVILNALRTPLVAVQSYIEYSLQRPLNTMFQWISAIDAWAKGGMVAGIADFMQGPGGDSYQEIYERNKKKGPAFNLGFGEETLETIEAAADKYLEEAIAKLKKRIKPLDLKSGDDGKNEPSPSKTKDEQGPTREASLLEKMGFVMRGGGASTKTDNLLQKIVDNTALLVKRTPMPLPGKSGVSEFF